MDQTTTKQLLIAFLSIWGLILAPRKFYSKKYISFGPLIKCVSHLHAKIHSKQIWSKNNKDHKTPLHGLYGVKHFSINRSVGIGIYFFLAYLSWIFKPVVVYLIFSWKLLYLWNFSQIGTFWYTLKGFITQLKWATK